METNVFDGIEGQLHNREQPFDSKWVSDKGHEVIIVEILDAIIQIICTKVHSAISAKKASDKFSIQCYFKKQNQGIFLDFMSQLIFRRQNKITFL